MPAGLPSPSDTNSTPDCSIALFIASRLLAIGVRLPVSKSRTVESETLALEASSVWDQPSQPRAARLCSGARCAILREIDKNS
jgi:hypothetical protein